MVLALLFGLGGCRNGVASPGVDWGKQRAEMVRRQIAARGVKDAAVLAAMGKVPRHRFVPARSRSRAYRDHPLPIGHDQTISQPYIVAFMTEALRLKPGRGRVLEIGTGSGYQAAVLAELYRKIYSVEIVKPLGQRARKLLLGELGYKNLKLRIGDGYKGWPKAAPFDAIMLTAAPPKIPPPLLAQLKKPGGVLVAPVGRAGDQELVRITRLKDGFKRERLLGVRFVPMTGAAQGKRNKK